MNRKISLGITLSLIIISCALTYIITSNYTLDTINKKVTNVSEKEQVYEKINEIDSQVKEHYYGKIDQNKIADAVASGYLNVLGDKYASYQTAEENEKRNNELDGIASGIGITASLDSSKYLKVEYVFPGSPADVNKIEVGSQIVAIDGKSVITLGYDKAVERLKGKAGSNVTLRIRLAGAEKDVAITRAEFELQSITMKMKENIAYIKISDFNNKTPVQFSSAINTAKEKNAKAIVFDLRNNLGGTLNSALEMLDILLPEGDIAYSTDKYNNVTTLKKSDKNEVNLPMAVLVNSKTASASELFSAALRDYDKAVLVGTTTYGKGVMQNTYQLSDGSSVTFTIGSFKTTKTPNFNGEGLKPDYEVSFDQDLAVDPSVLGTDQDVQLNKAFEVLKTKLASTVKIEH